MVSEKAKEIIGATVGVGGLILTVIMWIEILVSILELDFTLFGIDGNPLAWVVEVIGISMIVVGFMTYVNIRKKGAKEKIADFANPILKSKGKVSLHEIAAHLKTGEAYIELLQMNLESMIKEGYFEDTRFEGGWLVKNTIPCPYCGVPVSLAQGKCPECGGLIKK